MKPKDLKPAFTWETRQPLIVDRIFHIPRFYHEHARFSFPGWQDSALFGNELPVRIEYCSGNGSWIVEKAQSDANSNWVAVEKRFDRVSKLWAKVKNCSLKNLFIVCGDAYIFSQNYLPEASVDEIFINFPDPWPKSKHAKHRLMQKDFIQELARTLKLGSKITFVTDDLFYSKMTLEAFLQEERLQSLFPEPFYQSEIVNYGSSFFEDLWRSKGKEIRYNRFEKIK